MDFLFKSVIKKLGRRRTRTWPRCCMMLHDDVWWWCCCDVHPRQKGCISGLDYGWYNDAKHTHKDSLFIARSHARRNGVRLEAGIRSTQLQKKKRTEICVCTSIYLYNKHLTFNDKNRADGVFSNAPAPSKCAARLWIRHNKWWTEENTQEGEWPRWRARCATDVAIVFGLNKHPFAPHIREERRGMFGALRLRLKLYKCGLG